MSHVADRFVAKETPGGRMERLGVPMVRAGKEDSSKPGTSAYVAPYGGITMEDIAVVRNRIHGSETAHLDRLQSAIARHSTTPSLRMT